MKKRLAIMAIITVTGAGVSAASAENRAGTITLTPVIGGYHYDGTQGIDPNPIFGLHAGYNFTDRLGLEALFHYGRTKEYSTGIGKHLDVYHYRIEGLYSLFPKSAIVPHIAVGYGGISSVAKNNGKYDTDSGVFSYGLGAKFFLKDDVALRVDLRHLVIDHGPTDNNYEYTVGLGFAFGGKKAMPMVAEAPKAEVQPTPAAPSSNLSVSPATVVKGESAKLSWSSQETTGCAITPAIGSVPLSGSLTVTPNESTVYNLDCSGAGGSTSSRAGLTVTQPPAAAPAPPLDSDHDGVADNRDKCPDTPQGVAVDIIGCPLDTDGDRVADYLDKCPGTPAGVAVDASGCPLDSDKDGVADYLDKCPGTPLGVTVDAVGCPLDTDKDGVADYLDKCPDTPFGTKVDAVGCPLPLPSACKSITLEIEFDTAKAVIKPRFDNEIKKLAVMLQDNPDATAVIEGHTDNVGGAAMNMKLSEKRADAVRTYLIDKFGIAANRLQAKGYGLTKPRASNKTAQGRHENRRVEAVISCNGKIIKATDHDTHK